MRDKIREAVAAAYARIGREGSNPPPGLAFPTGAELALRLGYPAEILEKIPSDALGGFVGAAALPALALAGGQPGERVLDCGAGSGVDAYWLALAGRRVAALDASPEMLGRLARSLDRAPELPGAVTPVLALLPELPFRSASFGAALASGVANLVPERQRFWDELFRVLAPGGRLFAADVVALGELDQALRGDPDAWAFCVGGAATPDAWRQGLEAAGFTGVEVELAESFPPLGRALIRAFKP